MGRIPRSGMVKDGPSGSLHSAPRIGVAMRSLWRSGRDDSLVDFGIEMGTLNNHERQITSSAHRIHVAFRVSSLLDWPHARSAAGEAGAVPEQQRPAIEHVAPSWQV